MKDRKALIENFCSTLLFLSFLGGYSNEVIEFVSFRIEKIKQEYEKYDPEKYQLFLIACRLYFWKAKQIKKVLGIKD